MATKKKTAEKVKVTSIKKTTKKAAPLEVVQITPTVKKTLPKSSSRRFVLNLLLVILVGATIFLLAKRYRGMFIAGIVNKSPISRFELNKVLVDRYGSTVLEELVNERLLSQAAKENKIEVTEEEINNEIKKLEESLGGKTNLENAMLQYNIDENGLKKQVELRLTQQKLMDKLFTIEVTQEEVEEYYATNKAAFEGKGLNEVKDQISTDLKDQKRQQKFSEWFQELKAKSQVANYLTK